MGGRAKREEEEASCRRIMTAVRYQAVIFPGHHSRHARNVASNRERRAIGEPSVGGDRRSGSKSIVGLENWKIPWRVPDLTPSTFSLMSRPAAASSARRIDVAVPVCLEATRCTAVCCLGCAPTVY